MRLTLTPRISATAGFCAAACIERPVRVRLRNSVSTTTMLSDTMRLRMSWIDTAAPKKFIGAFENRAGNGCASAE